jgi:hypothetical protein
VCHPDHRGSLFQICTLHPLAHPYTAETVAKVFFADIIRLHGVPASIDSDRDVMFTSGF